MPDLGIKGMGDKQNNARVDRESYRSNENASQSRGRDPTIISNFGDYGAI